MKRLAARRRGLESVVAGLFFALISANAHSQSANARIGSLLSNNCQGLSLGGAPTNPDISGLGAQLGSICTSPQTLAGAAVGGAAAAFQAGFAGFVNSSARNYLDDERAKAAKDGALQLRATDTRSGPETYPGFAAATVQSVAHPFAGSIPGVAIVYASDADTGSKGIGVVASLRVESIDRKGTDFEEGYDAINATASLGVDYRFTDHLSAGALVSLGRTDGDFDAGGDFTADAAGGVIFLSILPSEHSFVDVSVGIIDNQYDVNRRARATVQSIALGNNRIVDGVASSSSDGNTTLASISAGYDFPQGALTVGPRVAVNYSRTKIDGYSEQGTTGLELQYDNQYIESLQGSLGVFGSYVRSIASGVLSLQGNVDLIHEFKNDQRSITAQFVQDRRSSPTRFSYQNDAPDRTFFQIGVGAVWVLPNGWQPYGRLQGMIGNSLYDNYRMDVGVRVEF